MKTVYFDSQIFRELKKEENKSLLDKILKLKNDKLEYVYFDAHIYDLQNDKTDKKIEGEIDKIVYWLYGLSEEEIKIIEGK